MGTVERVPTIATIGVYTFDPETFLEVLDEAGVVQVIDVRQRRGVRGARYAWANAQRLHMTGTHFVNSSGLPAADHEIDEQGVDLDAKAKALAACSPSRASRSPLPWKSAAGVMEFLRSL